jgi:23S rRNA pseudouridine1911/1915/1917 synthase
VAKEKRTLEALLALLQSGKIEKTYHALVIGMPGKPRDTIDAPLLRIDDAQDEAKVRVDPLGQRAITHYKTLREHVREKYTLLECHIETGRTHQIRVHLASIGCPILGDRTYGNPLENSYARKYAGITRQLLHAYSLSFVHPILKKHMMIVAPYEEDFEEILSKKDI